MGARQEAAKARAAKAAAAAQASGSPPRELQLEYQARKGGTAKWKKGSRVLVPHVDQVGGRKEG